MRPETMQVKKNKRRNIPLQVLSPEMMIMGLMLKSLESHSDPTPRPLLRQHPEMALR